MDAKPRTLLGCATGGTRPVYRRFDGAGPARQDTGLVFEGGDELPFFTLHVCTYIASVSSKLILLALLERLGQEAKETVPELSLVARTKSGDNPLKREISLRLEVE